MDFKELVRLHLMDRGALDCNSGQGTMAIGASESMDWSQVRRCGVYGKFDINHCFGNCRSSDISFRDCNEP